MARYLPFLIALIAAALMGILYTRSKSGGQVPQFAELSVEDAERLEQQRSVVADAARHRYGTAHLTKTKADLPIIQKLIDDRAFGESQTYELQCLGVAFGDVLANELPLHWVMITDEYGTDPTLRFKNTSINVNALTMISKRIERGEAVDVSKLLNTTREYLAKLGKESR